LPKEEIHKLIRQELVRRYPESFAKGA